MDEYQDAASRIVAVLGEPGAREFPTLLEYTNTVRAEHSGNSTDEATATNVTGVIVPPLSLRGPTLTIRKFLPAPIA